MVKPVPVATIVSPVAGAVVAPIVRPVVAPSILTPTGAVIFAPVVVAVMAAPIDVALTMMPFVVVPVRLKPVSEFAVDANEEPIIPAALTKMPFAAVKGVIGFDTIVNWAAMLGARMVVFAEEKSTNPSVTTMA